MCSMKCTGADAGAFGGAGPGAVCSVNCAVGILQCAACLHKNGWKEDYVYFN